MQVIESIYQLSDQERFLLQSLLGRQVLNIYSDGVNLTANRAEYAFTGPLNMTLLPFDMYYIFRYGFHENALGEEYYTSDLHASSTPVQVNTSGEGGLSLPFASLVMDTEFIIDKIAVYGFAYDFVLEVNKPPRSIWKMFSAHKGEPVKCVVSTEHILIFTARDGQKMCIYPSSALPWIYVSFREEIIRSIEQGAEFYPFKHYKFKYAIQ